MVRRWAQGLTPKGWRHLALQVALLGSFEVVYALSGLYGRRHNELAIANARGLLSFERGLGVAWEHGVQNWVLHGHHVLLELANRTYFSSQFAVSIVFLLWVYSRRTESFARVRNALLAANYVSVVVLLVYPLAPPRVVPGAGFIDTLDANAVNLHSPIVNALNDPNSAMPSLHVSYALVVATAGVLLVRRWWLKLVWALYPVLVTFSIVATGNHFVLDAVGGALALLATPCVAWAAGALTAAWNRDRPREFCAERGGA